MKIRIYTVVRIGLEVAYVVEVTETFGSDGGVAESSIETRCSAHIGLGGSHVRYFKSSGTLCRQLAEANSRLDHLDVLLDLLGHRVLQSSDSSSTIDFVFVVVEPVI